MFDPSQCSRLVIYGGTFDPPHRAHVELPQHAAKAIDADGVLYVPAGRPPHKPDRTPTPAHHRLAMLKLALAGSPRAAIDSYELDRDEPSYTVHTLEHLRHERGDAVELRLLIGADMARIFDKWRQPECIVELAEPLVMLRPPDTCDALVEAITADPAKQEAWRRRMVEVPQIDVSSSALRQRLADGDSGAWVRRMLGPDVLNYIQEHGLYRRDRP